MPLEPPYCGQAPIPGTVTWNLDPVLLGFLAFAAATHLYAVRMEPGWKVHAARAGWVLTAAALVSPLCSLSVALFSARVAQHMILALVAAPLLATARPSCFAGPKRVAASSVVFAVLFWGWHLPPIYDATFQSTVLYWTMHLSMLVGAICFWAAVMNSRQPFAAAAASFLTSSQMGILGALFTFASRPLFSSHLGKTTAWGLSTLEDQQLGGLIMWVPAGLLLTVSFVLVLNRSTLSVHCRLVQQGNNLQDF